MSNLESMASLLRGYSYRYQHETDLHAAIEHVLRGAGVSGFDREFAINARNRFDFWFAGDGLAIEVKVDGSLSAALRQIDRYAELAEVRGILLASTCAWQWPRLEALRNKPVAFARLRRAFV